ncbi:MAG: FHA domain-containing protein [Anaerolineales bacterium]|nr:FHA domain-containing protein [Anaerolineales bacterium]
MESIGEETPILMAHRGPLSGQQWMIRESLVIGRDSTCDIVIPDRQVSRHHARLTFLKDGVYLEDLGSKNGTHHNGNRLTKKVILQDGDIVQIALAQDFTFVSADATMPLKETQKPREKKAPQPKLRLLKHSRQIWVGDVEINPPLSVAQFQMLETLYEQEGRVVSRKNLALAVWGEDEAMDVSDQALDALIRRLRDRLAEADPKHEFIITVRGHGLRLDNPLD